MVRFLIYTVKGYLVDLDKNNIQGTLFTSYLLAHLSRALASPVIRLFLLLSETLERIITFKILLSSLSAQTIILDLRGGERGRDIVFGIMIHSNHFYTNQLHPKLILCVIILFIKIQQFIFIHLR